MFVLKIPTLGDLANAWLLICVKEQKMLVVLFNRAILVLLRGRNLLYAVHLSIHNCLFRMVWHFVYLTHPTCLA